MTTDKYFDKIADGYNRVETGSSPIRQFSESYTLLKLISQKRKNSVLELACSDGYFTRLLNKAGANSVLGIDISSQMIEIARNKSLNCSEGVEYKVANMFDIVSLGQFDLALLSFAMSYAKDWEELLALCRITFDNLNSGGQIFSMNDNPFLLTDSETGFLKYGKTKKIIPPVKDGATIMVTWNSKDQEGRLQKVTFNCNYFTYDTIALALSEAGFIDIRMHYPKVSPEGIDSFGCEYWELFLKHPLLVYFEGKKP